MLYDPALHEPLTDEAWDEPRVRNRIGAIVADAVAAYDPGTLWPAHEWDAFRSESPVRGLYVGAAGVIWGLDALRRAGHAEVGIDLPTAALRTLELVRERADYAGWGGDGWDPPSTPEASLLAGESGVLLVAWRLTQDRAIADALHRRVRENADNEAIEIMWGSPGTMLAAAAMHRWTGEPRWQEAWRESADRLLATRDEDGLWTQTLYGATRRSLTPPHGLAGIARVLRLGGQPHADAGEIARRTAVLENGGVNWPTVADTSELAGRDGQIRLQWCGGAPGMAIALADDLDEELLVAAAETTWRAGPFGKDKEPSICQGTAGNGFALLKTFERTGDELWLERARRFAVHALAQVERMPPRYSLFTGGIGTAIFAARCLEARADYPTVDSWD